jgi:hypothetical protein
MVLSVDFLIVGWFGIVRGVRLMIALTNNLESKKLKGLNNFLNWSINRKLRHQTDTPASAINASRIDRKIP